MTAKKVKIDRTLSELLSGILIYGVVCQLTIVWFVSHKGYYSIGLWTGILTASIYAYHLWWTISRNMTFNADNEKGATAYSLKHSVIRYAAVALILAGLWYIGGNTSMLSGFLGVMGVKVGAYMQPLVVKLTYTYKKTE